MFEVYGKADACFCSFIFMVNSTIDYPGMMIANAAV